MKKLTAVLLLIFLIAQQVFSQNVLNLKIKEKEVLYLEKTEDNKLLYLQSKDKKDAFKDTESKDNQLNIYLKWVNPLRYKITWKDTAVSDERDKAINDFLSILVGQFGTKVTELNTKAPVLKNQNEENVDGKEVKGREFKNINLLLLLIQLRTNQAGLEKDPKKLEATILSINELSQTLKELEDLNTKDFSKNATDIYTTLFEYKDATTMKENIQIQQDNAKKLNDDFTTIDKLRQNVSKQVENLTITNTLLYNYTKSVILNYLDESLVTLNVNKKIIEKLNPIFTIMNNSTKNESAITPYFYKLRSVDFDNGKKLETKLSITEYEFNKDTKEFFKKAVVVEKTIVLQKYDYVHVFASTGLFYGSTTLSGFGVSNDNNSQFVITEDNINKNNAVTAAFLNFSFGTSRYFAPLVQLGVDPTKTRPFLLFGGGFSVPSAKFAISGGAIWTWNQSLDKLSVGSTVASTTDLQKDIKYNFEVKPKGFYIGIQYNFK